MHKAIIGASVSLLLACEPSLDAGQGARCSESRACDEGLSCYRGFCLPDLESPADAALSQEGAAATSDDGDAGARVAADARDAGAQGAPRADAAPAQASTPSSHLDAAAAPPDMPPPAMRAPPAADASASASSASAVPDAFVLPADCMLKDCCREAQAAAEPRDEEEEEEERRGKPGKACGCDDPQLFERLFCSAL